MVLERDQLQNDILALYRREHDELGETGTLELLEKGREFDFSNTFSIMVLVMVIVQRILSNQKQEAWIWLIKPSKRASKF